MKRRLSLLQLFSLLAAPLAAAVSLICSLIQERSIKSACNWVKSGNNQAMACTKMLVACVSITSIVKVQLSIWP